MMNNCINLRIRSKKGIKYFLCVRRKAEIERKECFCCNTKEFKKVAKMTVKTPLRAIAKKQSKRTKATSIPKKVKDEVFKRDKGICVFCGKPGLPECHYIKRSQNGLGIPKNIFTGCRTCHNKFDESIEREKMLPIAKKHLKELYPDWKEEDLIYHKYNF